VKRLLKAIIISAACFVMMVWVSDKPLWVQWLVIIPAYGFGAYYLRELMDIIEVAVRARIDAALSRRDDA